MLIVAVFIKIHPFAWTWHVNGSKIEPDRNEIKLLCVKLLLAKIHGVSGKFELQGGKLNTFSCI